MAQKSKSAPSTGVAHIQATFNNTVITVTTTGGDTISQCSGGHTQKGARKSTQHAAEMAAQEAAKKATGMGMREVSVIIKGPGAGRESSIRGLVSGGLKVREITEATPVPHNGCRQRKKKRN